MTGRPDQRPPWTRRGLLLAALGAGGAGLAACSVTSRGAAPEVTATTTATSTVTETVPGPVVTETVQSQRPPAAVLPERPPAYVVLPGEVLPACKQAAVDFVVAVMSFDDLGRDDDAIAQRLAPTGQAPQAAGPLLGLLPGAGPGALQVRYAQYGGLTPAEDRASQMIVGDQLLLDDSGALVRRPFGADVRLTREGDRWVVTSVTPAYPDPPLPPLTPVVEALLADTRIDLPGLAEADLRSGVVADTVAAGLLALADRWRIGVHVFYSAHPINVFATSRPSAHTVGRAVDVFSLDGVPVIQQDRSPWQAFMAAAPAAGCTDVGGPVDLGAGYFTDRVHQDHVHLGFPLSGDRRV